MRRHFNQAEEIARPLAKRLLLPVETNLCRRKIHTPEQSGLDASRRRMNLRDAFAVTGDVSSLHVALIDDVMTTGSTLAALSKKLLAAGAAKVDVWTVARVAGSADQQPPPGREGVARIS